MITYRGPDFVYFDSKPQISLYENALPLSIPVSINIAQTEKVQVTFEVIGENILTGSDYIIQTPSPVEIPRNKYSTTITIQPINNAIIQTEKRTITIRIKSVNNTALTLQVVKEVVIDLLDDDCSPTVPKASIWVGALKIQGGSSGITPGTGEGGAGGICGGSLVVDGYFFGTNNSKSRITILMTQNSSFPTKGFTSVIRAPLFKGFTTYDYEASGTYDEVSKNITLNFTVYYNPNHNDDFSGTHIITP